MTDVMTSTPSPPRRPPAPPPPGGVVRVLWLVFGAVLALGAVTVGAYQVVVLLSHEEREENTRYPGADLTAIDVSNGSGSVRVVGGAGDEVVVHADISDGLRSTGERQQVVGDVLQVRATCPNFGSDWCRVSYVIEIPRDLAVTIRADDGSVDVTGIAGPVDVDADNGSVELVDVTGPVRVSSANGRIEGFALRSAMVSADSDNGRVTLEFAAAPTTVTAIADNGSVEVVVPDDEAAYRLDLRADNGSTTEDVPQDSSSPRSITIRTANGSATATTRPRN